MFCDTYQVTFCLEPTVQIVPVAGEITGGTKTSRDSKMGSAETKVESRVTKRTKRVAGVNFIIIVNG